MHHQHIVEETARARRMKPSMTIIVVAVVSLLASGSTAFGAVGPPASRSGVSLTPSSLKTAGLKLLRPVAVRQLADGGVSYVFAVPGGQATLDDPPTGFDSLRATAVQLARYGYPARPGGADALARWRHLVARMRPFDGDVLIEAPSSAGLGCANVQAMSVALTAVCSAAEGAPSFPANGNGVDYYDYWSGFDANPGAHNGQAPGGGAFSEIHGQWTEPNYWGNTSMCSNNAAATWVGIGDANSNGGLIQAGFSWGNPSGANHVGFFEAFPRETEMLVGQDGKGYNHWPLPNGVQPFTIPSGHMAWAQVIDHASQSNPQGTYQWALQDRTALSAGASGPQYVQSGTDTDNPGQWVDDITAEWITERPGAASGGNYNLAEWDSSGIPWSNVSSTGASGQMGVTFNGQQLGYLDTRISAWRAVMWSRAFDRPMAAPDPNSVSSNGFTTQYSNCD